jgi:pyruvate dehydrogenase E1 component alpha subunit
MGAHTTTDDPTRYRNGTEVESWKLRDPIARVRAFLTKQGIGDDDFFASVDADADRITGRLREYVIDMPDPTPETLFEHVYADESPLQDAERAWFRDYQASFAGEAH